MSSRKEILELLTNGKITAAEAADLLSKGNTAVPESPPSPEAAKAVSTSSTPTPKNGQKPSWLHVRVRDMASGKNKVTVNVPLGMVKYGLKIGGRFSPELNEIDWNELEGMMNETQSGILVDVEDEEGGEHVQVYID